MTRQLELKAEEKRLTRGERLLRILEYELAGAIEATGLVFLGFAVYYDTYECMLVLKADAGNSKQVAFVYSDDIAGTLIKAVNGIKSDRVRWREDTYKK